MTHVFPCVLHITLCNNLLSPENPRSSLFVQSESCLKCSAEQQNKEPLETVVLKPELTAESPGGLVSTSAASPQSSWFSSSGVCGAWEFAFPTGFQLMLLLLQGPHFENHYFKEITLNLHCLLKWITLYREFALRELHYVTVSHLFIQNGPCEWLSLERTHR